jgi:protein-S-isoprenylcysteine O-methyltransferase Ste14
LYFRLTAGALIVVGGLYLVNESHKLVIDADEPVLVDWGVYGLARHPMYLGIMMAYLGMTVATTSIASLLILVSIFYIYDRIADYEETRIIEELGKKYIEYCGKVPRWLVI